MGAEVVYGPAMATHRPSVLGSTLTTRRTAPSRVAAPAPPGHPRTCACMGQHCDASTRRPRRPVLPGSTAVRRQATPCSGALLGSAWNPHRPLSLCDRLILDPVRDQATVAEVKAAIKQLPPIMRKGDGGAWTGVRVEARLDRLLDRGNVASGQ